MIRPLRRWHFRVWLALTVILLFLLTISILR